MVTMARLLKRYEEGRPFEPREWTLDPNLVRTRLIETVTPSIFECLVVSLLQLEQPQLAWLNVGGSGDAGVDGLAYDETGNVVSLLQCKWAWKGHADAHAEQVWSTGRNILVLYLAYLVSHAPAPSWAHEVFDLHRLVTLTIKHHWRLPLAQTLRIGAGAT